MPAGDDHRYQVRRVVGQGWAEELVQARVELPRPAAEILELRKNVFIDSADATLENVILQGRVRSRLIFAVADPGAAPLSGAIWPPLSGPVWATLLDTGFTSRVAVAGARPAMSVTVTDAFVASDTSVIAGTDPHGAITAVLDRSLIQIGLSLTETVTVEEHRRGHDRPSPPAPPPTPAAAVRFATRRPPRA